MRSRPWLVSLSGHTRISGNTDARGRVSPPHTPLGAPGSRRRQSSRCCNRRVGRPRPQGRDPLTTQSELASITLPQRLFGITLSARDVDHDNDEALIVSDSSSLQRDQVYLNDGHGHFTWSEHWAQGGLLASLTTSALADPACSSLEQCACQNEQPPIDSSSLGALCSVRERSEPVMAAHSACYALLLDFQLRPRSPPAA